MTYEETTNPLRGVESKGDGHYGIYDHGAHVWAYQPKGQEHPVIWLSEKADLREGQPIRGGIPIVFPWFAMGPEGKHEPKHGFARLDTWHRADIKDTTPQDGRFIVEYTLDDAMDHTDFPYDYSASLVAKFTPEYVQVAMYVTNEGEEPFTFESAFHTYLEVGDIRQVTIDGLDGRRFFDKAPEAKETDRVQEGPVTFTGETDRIYTHNESCVLTDPVYGRRLEISKSGSANTVIWNPWDTKAATMTDFGDDEWQKMVCIETANVLDKAITLRPGETHSMRQRVTIL